MTRDATRLHNVPEVSEAEVYAALWDVAPFPRLPFDAPPELKRLVIEIDDPKRVYKIHRANRRHHFQLLVERYILQIRYGCTSKTCNTPTCFSCRKKLANGAPVRRYNSTGARAFATYLASQDNPEQGLCHNPPAAWPVPEITRPHNPHHDISANGKTPVTGSGRRNKFREELGDDLGTLESQPPQRISREDFTSPKLDPSLVIEPAKVDHRSFVQNLVETAAYKMLEWLTPRNLGRMASALDAAPVISNANLDGSVDSKPSQDKREPEPAVNGANGDRPAAHQKELMGNGSATPAKSASNGILSAPVTTVSHTPSFRESSTQVNDAKPNGSAQPRSPTRQKKPESLDSPGLKGILSKVPKTPETDTCPSRISNIPRPKRKVSQQTLITSPQMRVTELAPLVHETILSSTRAQSVATESPAESTNEKMNDNSMVEEQKQAVETPPPADDTPKPPAPCLSSLPQSLLYMPPEAIELLCDIAQEGREFENGFLYPPTMNRLYRRRRIGYRLLGRTSYSEDDPTKKRWSPFIEQTFFDVLSKPDTCLRTFSDDKRKLYDTQTIWYLMFRLTRASPSVVYDSLWNMAGSLFRPPKQLAAYDWAKDFHSQAFSSSRPIPDQDAASLINICLHTLVATAPLLEDARQMANMSRIRSHGFAMLGRESSSLESVDLCLQYEDAFTNELPMRLARRVFAAIPTRRRFTELLELQNDVRKEGESELDILENVIGTLKILDSGAPPALDFPPEERILHEKRVPIVILDWARTVMLQDWKGTAEVPSDGAFGGALATMAAIYKNRKSLLLGDIHFRTEYFAERLDPVDMPLQWLSFQPNKKTVHLLDYPYLFHPSTLVTYFRAINFSRMNEYHEQAKAKNGFVYAATEEGRLMTDRDRRDRLFERLRTSITRFMVLEIRRTQVLTDTFNSIWRREERELLRPLKVRLGEDSGEEGLDSGGVQQEFFRLAIAEALDPDYGAFTVDSRTKMAWFQPSSPEPLWKFELIGMLVSLAVYNGLTLPVTFPKALYRKLLEQEVNELHHIADGWPELANGLTTLLEWDEKEGLVEDVFARTYEFSVEQFGQPVFRSMLDTSSSVPQWPQFSAIHSNPSSSSNQEEEAPLVTNANRNAYVSDYIRWLTDISVAPQFAAFAKGFFTCFPPRSISLFDPSTLQSVVEGIQDIDISELRRFTRYIGWEGDASHHTIRDFWAVVKRYDLEQKKRLLEFVTASDRVPVGGMRGLAFTIQRNGGGVEGDDGKGDERLPTAYTCYGILLLPEYSERAVLERKLGVALDNSKGFGFA